MRLDFEADVDRHDAKACGNGADMERMRPRRRASRWRRSAWTWPFETL
jgi:hypothetical protein